MIALESLLLTLTAVLITAVFIGLFRGLDQTFPPPASDSGIEDSDYPTPIYPTLHAWVVGPRAIHAHHVRRRERTRRGCPLCYELGLHLRGPVEPRKGGA